MIYYQTIVVGVNILVFILLNIFKIYLLEKFALIPYLVIENGEYWRLITNCLCHGSLMHLFFNMNAVVNCLPSLIILKDKMFKIIFSLLFFYNIIYLMSSYILKYYFYNSTLYYTPVIGFSGVLFGLIYINSHLNPYLVYEIMGFSFLNQYSPLVVLFFSQMMGRNVSLLGHISGIISGIITVYILNL
ncbi:Rhomboid family [seawater metagenome]|uniref:Rhomboid family n=1 Tax=seawater metagenome TaxID=1561972 RepID=A0A5E8CJS5_9ZZZZ